jgi:hypothetical protein
MLSRRTRIARPATSSGTSSEMKWLGQMSAVLSNQKSDICVSTRPLSGMSVGMITSYAEMRSEATIRRSPSTSYISRTLPVE